MFFWEKCGKFFEWGASSSDFALSQWRLSLMSQQVLRRRLFTVTASFLWQLKLLPRGIILPPKNGFINIQMTYMCLCHSGLFQTTMKSTEPDGNENKIQEKCGTCCRRTLDH